MRLRTIAATFMVAAPLFAFESSQAAACWGRGYGYTASTTTTPVAPRRYGYTSYGYSSPAYYGGYYGARVGGVGWRRGYGYGVGRVGVRRVGVGRVGRWR
jgi:hypothetical protein